MADENAGDEEKTANQVDVVRKARQLLVTNPSWCKELDHSSHRGTNDSARGDGRGGKTHEHGSIDCILAFLGDGVFSLTMIESALAAISATRNFLKTHLKEASNLTGQIGANQILSFLGDGVFSLTMIQEALAAISATEGTNGHAPVVSE